MPWVFWHTHQCRQTAEAKTGHYTDRKTFMKTLCRKAGVKYFRFHALRQSGASLMDACNVPIGSIQRILGHENRTTTEIYLHSIGESERAAIAVFEKARQKSHTDSHLYSHTSKGGLTVHSPHVVEGTCGNMGCPISPSPNHFSPKDGNRRKMSFTSKILTRSTIQLSCKQSAHEFQLDLLRKILAHEMNDHRLQ